MMTLRSDHIVGNRRPRLAFIQLDEDALARAHLCSLNDRSKVFGVNARQAARATRIIQYVAVLHHVGDAILKLSKYVVAMIDTQAIARTEVLVNPHAHDSARYRPFGSGDE